MDETAVDASITPSSHVPVRAESEWERATVKWFNRVRGFGFLTRGAGPEIFVHLETVQRSGLAELRPGQLVQVRWGMGGKGPTAAELRPDPPWISSGLWL
jgi:CspA family cold shock protein